MICIDLFNVFVLKQDEGIFKGHVKLRNITLRNAMTLSSSVRFIFNYIKSLPVDEDLESSEVPKKTPSRRNLFKWTSLNLDEADDETKTNASGE